MVPETPQVLFRQFFDPDTSTYTYLLADGSTREAVIIDSVQDQFERDRQWLEELGLKLRWILETHVHADHITGAHQLREAFGAQVAALQNCGVEGADHYYSDGEELPFGGESLRVLTTPGHTDSCCSFYWRQRVFTGDALMIRGCGRTDFQQGSSERLFHSVREKLFALPPETLVYPGHNYRGVMASSIGEEMNYNPRLKLENSVEQFMQIMDELKLAPPKRIDEAVPANLRLGRPG